MKIKTSQIFYLFVALLVAGVYYFDYYRGEENKKKEDQSAILVPLAKDDITRIELRNLSGELELVKNESGWELKKPVNDLAGSDEVSGWLQSLTIEKSLEKLGEGESFEWSTYGLEHPQSTIQIYSTSGQAVKLEISARKNFEGNPFIRKNDEKVVYVGVPVWSSLFERNMKELRDKRILRTPLSELVSFTINKNGSVLRLDLNEGRWVANAKPQWKLDQNKARELVNTLQEMRASDFILESDPSPEDIVQFGIGVSALKVIYQVGNNKMIGVALGQGRDKSWYVWPRDLKKVYKVDGALIEKLTKAKLEDLRDRETPFNFNKEDVIRLSVTDGENIEISREGQSWRAATKENVQTPEVNQLIENIRQLRVSEFLDGQSTAPGLEKSKKRYALANLEGKSLIELTIGDSFKKKVDNVDKTYFYAKSSLYPGVFALNDEDVKSLMVDKLFKAESKEAEQKTNATGNNGGSNK